MLCSQLGCCTYVKVGVPVGDLDRVLLIFIEDIPMVDGGICDESQFALADPLPKYHVFVHRCRLQLLLIVQVEDLDRSRLSLEGDNVEVPVHNSTIGFDWASSDIVAVLEVDDDDFG